MTRTVDMLRVVALPGREALGAEAADYVAGRLRDLMTSQARVRVAFAAAASQTEFLDSLARADALDWSRIDAFQLDEYVGLPRGDSRTFASWLDRHIFSRVHPGRVEILDGSVANPAIECRRYGALIADGGLDLALVGVGDNGHVAFNEPLVADPDDPETVRLVELDEMSRLQQVRDGEFRVIAAVPQRALTLTMSAILGSRAVCAVVPGKAKAAAIASLLDGPISPECPGSALRHHPDAVIFADADALSQTKAYPRGDAMTAAPLTAAYLERIGVLLARIANEEAGSISKGAAAVADRVAADRLIYVFGPGGHSAIGAQEVFFRAGGLACVSAILDEGFSLSHGGRRSMSIERTPGYARAILRNVGLVSGDILIIVNAYGVNSACIDSAIYARELGVTTVGVTSVELQRALPGEHPARHPGKQNLCDLVDILIDTKVPMGDAVMQVENVPERVGPISTFANAFAMNALMLETTNELAQRGIDPPVWRSGNSPGGDEAGQALTERYKSRVSRL